MSKMFEFDITNFKEFEGNEKEVSLLRDYLLNNQNEQESAYMLDIDAKGVKINVKVLVAKNKAYIALVEKNAKKSN